MASAPLGFMYRYITLRAPKHRSHYHYGRRCGQHDPYIHRPMAVNRQDVGQERGSAVLASASLPPTVTYEYQ